MAKTVCHGDTESRSKALVTFNAETAETAEPERGVASMGRPAARADGRDRLEPMRERMIDQVSLAHRFESGLGRPEGTPIDAVAAPL